MSATTASRQRKTSSSSAATSTVQVLLLTQKAEVKEVKLTTAADGTITLPMIQALLKKKELPEFLGSYKYKSAGLFLFGYLNGKAGQENKHELPPPHDTILPFGDIVLLASKDTKSWKQPTPFKSEEYETFYTKAFGGFENLDDEEEDEEIEEEDIQNDEEVEGCVEEDQMEEESEESDDSDDSDNSQKGDDEDAVDSVGGDAIDEEPVRKPARTPTPRARKGKRVVTAAAAAATAAQVFTTYLYVPQKEELQPESFESGDYSAQAVTPKRVKTLRSLTNLFAGHLDQTECQQLERCIYTAAIRTANQRHIGKTWSHLPFVEIYETAAKHIAANFHPSSYVKNPELFERYKHGNLRFAEIAEMDVYQLFEGRWHDSFQAQQMREKRQLEGNKAMATDRFLCSRCHKRECTYYEMQTRSADEPMTIFITCLNCGKHWRQ